jgi:proteic killer suppression protein
VIRSFRCRDTQRVFYDQPTQKFPPDILRKARIKLLLLDAAVRVEELREPPSNRLEVLLGDRAGQYSIRINRQWRICFDWYDGGAENVEIVDYH